MLFRGFVSSRSDLVVFIVFKQYVLFLSAKSVFCGWGNLLFDFAGSSCFRRLYGEGFIARILVLLPLELGIVAA